jgi:serine protease
MIKKRLWLPFLIFLGLEFLRVSASTNTGTRHWFDQRPRPAVRRDVPIAPGVVVVKHRNPRLAKAGGGVWGSVLCKAGGISVEPRFAAHQSDGTELGKILEVRLAPGADVWKAVEALYQDPSVEWAEPLYLRKIHYTPNDPELASQWYLDKIKAREAWDVHRSSNDVVIGIVDLGVKLSHPDLAANIWTNTKEIPNNGLDDDRNGYVDDVHGWDFGDKDNDPNPSEIKSSDGEQKGWHGTGVAATASAVTNNRIGIAGVAFNAHIMPVKASKNTDPDQYITAGYDGITYAVDNGADIVNCSWGGPLASFAERDVIAYADSKGVLVVASAGNDHMNVSSYPAALPVVLSVAATDEGDVITDFSNYGYYVDVSAPGENFYTAWWKDGYDWLRGTSFSAPLTAGVAALVKSYHPTWTGRQVGEQVRVSADPIDVFNPSFAGKLGKGRVNAYQALTLKSPSIRIDDAEFSEGSDSNHDGDFDLGEEILLTIRLKNYLEPADNIQVLFNSLDSALVFEENSFLASHLGMLETVTNDQNPMKLRISPNAPNEQHVRIEADISAGGSYEDLDSTFFDILNSSYATIEGGEVRMTVSSNGRLGSASTYLNIGDGFVFGSEMNLLYEGAFMAAVSVDSVSDAARGLDPGNSPQNWDFSTAPGGEITVQKPGELADEQTSNVFTDEKTDPSLHLGISETAYSFKNAPNADFVLVAYSLYNYTDRPIFGLYAGLFMDWDISYLGGQDLGGFDSDLNLAYIYDPDSRIHGALQIVSKGIPINYKFIKNADEIYPEAGGYSDDKKWQHLSGGIRNDTLSEAADYSHVLGVGPVDIQPGDTVMVGYAVLGGEDLTALRNSAAAAMAKWDELLKESAVKGPELNRSLRFGLSANFPNPFNPETTIRYEIAEKCQVRLTVFDVAGREVFRLADQIQEPGRYEVRWQGKTDSGFAPSGVYICRLCAGSFTQTRKMLLLR